jgi:tRNA modification GTPase
VVRLSGPRALAIAGGVVRGRTRPDQQPSHTLRRVSVVDPATGERLDEALCAVMRGPRSYTGEDVVELSCHGAPALLRLLVERLVARGARLAQPGEFTRRAFLNGRLDLTAVEGLADLVDAETRAQARQALRQLDGALGRLYGGWRAALLRARARLEAEIDFAPEQDVPAQLLETVRPDVRRLSAEIAAHLADGHRGERLRAGLAVAVLGPPNAGKSSLVNRLARRDVAIVTPIAGTTRDVIEVQLDLAGIPVTLLDTAGLREAADPIEAEGVRRARSRAEHADVRLIMFDGAAWPELDPATLAMIDDGAVIVINKRDLAVLPAPLGIRGRAALPVSCLTGEGIAALLEALAKRAAGLLASGAEPLLTRARHRAALHDAAEALARFSAAPDHAELALLAEDLRLATRALGRITGEVAVEEVLDRIFAEFCIGK